MMRANKVDRQLAFRKNAMKSSIQAFAAVAGPPTFSALSTDLIASTV
jgi:hypothetical protein